ncbi:uncharacterized protein MYCFIDRAFT_127947 [Pseudocercospora fijiensis CIRAD86]|uniref:Inosine/uridine-preferring nucleoside hydrolase domain-containing protein n=1 Tax=Pseudocercospora fijiensis (strain CIRAD86) TaxID=383855 RepID=N1Q6B6_PSEFD|nr:uncharacterized protein MYCFIDRAFT_127947 [Pseudocercospora fijiensis CIRAD86]EME87845.1 hypothetical protein MYCFIDRAFT_127947 [Pseudocercospora fijiensis CIRAD86]
MAPRRVIIDTDPGVDDVVAMLLAFSALPEELEVLLLSVTYGNIDVQNCLRNVVSLFFHIEKEIEWRKSQGKTLGFDGLRKQKPLVAIGPEHPLADQLLMADFFHGTDGLGGIHETHPRFTPAETWKQLFTQAGSSQSPADRIISTELQNANAMFTPSQAPADEEILRLLRDNEPDTITIVAIGPLTNLALAAAKDTETFLRAKEIVVMGGTIFEHGNITPCAEFNTFADSYAAARLYALTSPNPSSTMPPAPPAPAGQPEGQHPPPYLAPYPENLSRRLKVTLFPLDITEQHILSRGTFRKFLEPQVAAGSPLADWAAAFLTATFHKVESLQQNLSGDAVGLQLHDPLTIWYCMATTLTGKSTSIFKDEDLRVETSGQWTRGMYVIDRRTRKKLEEGDPEAGSDHGKWLSVKSGNRLDRCIGSPQTSGQQPFGEFLLQRVFGIET